MNNKHIFLSYNEWEGDYHKGFDIKHMDLSPIEIQSAIYLYIADGEELRRSNLELKKIVDELMEENKALRRFKDKWQEQYNSGY